MNVDGSEYPVLDQVANSIRPSSSTDPAPNVLRVGDRLDVRRIDAKLVAAEMVEDEAVRYRHKEQEVCGPMRTHHTVALVLEAAVARIGDSAAPRPTAEERELRIELR